MNKSNKNSNKKPNPMALKAMEHLKRVKEEEDRINAINLAIQEEENRKIKEEADKLKAIEDKKQQRIQAKIDKKAAQIEAGTYKTKNQKIKERKLEQQRSRLISTTLNVEENVEENVELNIEENVELNIEENVEENLELNIEENIKYRSPIICVMGHVDTGKTKLMDKIRNTNVQEGEVAGITQQIGATFIPNETLIKKININNIKISNLNIKIPGLLMIDTPGHEAFSNLRKRGSSLADIVIIVIDLVHGLEQQTIESLNILQESNTKFIIALNKIDRLYGWNSVENCSIIDAFETNKETCSHEFNDRLYNIQGQLKSQGINSELYWNNNSYNDTISICPISAITGEGISDLLQLIINISQTELHDSIIFTEELKCIIMEKTSMEGVGITVDALLINGTLNKGNNIIIKTNNGVIKTQIRNLLTPPPNCESRVTSTYNTNLSLSGSIGFKLIANNLENVIIGSTIFIDSNNNKISIDDDIVYSNNDISNNDRCNDIKYNLQDIGVIVYTSSEGSLEALIHHLQVECKPPVPISGVYIGKVMKKHITKMIISNKIELKKNINQSEFNENNTILAFDVNIDNEAIDLAQLHNIKIISDGTIFRLFNQYELFRQNIINERKEKHKHLVVYPCIISIIKNNIYHKKSPFVFGIKVIEGNLHINTPLIIPSKKIILGRVISIQNDGKNIDIANKGSEVCIKVEDINENNIQYSRHFDYNDTIFSNISKISIETMKNYFKDEITTNDGKLNDTGKLLKILQQKIL
jgi:translation initiation factor 5B